MQLSFMKLSQAGSWAEQFLASPSPVSAKSSKQIRLQQLTFTEEQSIISRTPTPPKMSE